MPCSDNPRPPTPARAREFYVRRERETWSDYVATDERGRAGDDSLHRFNCASNERRLHLADGVIDRRAPAFVQDFDAEDLAGSARSMGIIVEGM